MAGDKNKADAAAPSEPGKKKLLLPGVVAAAMLIEGAGIFGAMKMFGAGAGSAAALSSIAGEEGEGRSHSTELMVAEFKALNEKSGVTYLVDISVSARVAADKGSEVRTLLSEREATVVDRLTQAIRSVSAEHLKEEDLATVRRKMKFELDKILDDETMISELLITRFQKFRADL